MNDDDSKRPGKIPPSSIQDAKAELFFGEKPALGGRFKPGQSGNPSGRPKKAQQLESLNIAPIYEAFLSEIDKTVSIQKGGQTKTIPRREALATAVIKGALNGVAPTQRLAFEILAVAEREQARQLAREHEIFENYCLQCRAEITDAERKGEPVPQPLPHPDDIVIVPGKRVWFRGPFTPEELAKCQDTCTMRDTFIMQDALDRKLAGENTMRSAMLCAMILNCHVPKRMQLSDNEILSRVWRYDVATKRDLLKQVRQAWQAVGRPKPRGWISPPQDLAEKILSFGYDLVATHAKGELDLAAMGRGEFDEATLDLMERHGISAA